MLCKHGWPVEQAGKRPGGPTREDKVTFEECEIPCPPSRAGTHVAIHVMDTDSGIKKVEDDLSWGTRWCRSAHWVTSHIAFMSLVDSNHHLAGKDMCVGFYIAGVLCMHDMTWGRALYHIRMCGVRAHPPLVLKAMVRFRQQDHLVLNLLPTSMLTASTSSKVVFHLNQP